MAADVSLDFRVLFDAAPSAMMVLTPDLTILEVNPLYEEVVGRCREKLVGRELFDAFPGDESNTGQLRRSVNRVLSTGRADFLPMLHYPVAAKDGGEQVDRYWSCSQVPIRDADGKVAFVLQQTQDITALYRAGRLAVQDGEGSLVDRAERVQALNISLLAESAQLRNLFMRSPSFMCLLREPDYRFELVNPAFQALVGRRELIGRTFREAIPEADGQLYLDMMDKVYSTGEAFVGKQMRAEFEQVAGAGPQEVFISFVFQPIFDDGGHVRAIFVDGNDVTDHVRAERSQALLVRELHHRVRNTLATVQGVMNSTARTAETIEDYQWAFSGRISSLARTHSLLTEEIQQFVSFANLLRQEIGAYADGAHRTGGAGGAGRGIALAARRAARHDDPRARHQRLPSRRPQRPGRVRDRDLDDRSRQGQAHPDLPLDRDRWAVGLAPDTQGLRLDDPHPRPQPADRGQGRCQLFAGGLRAPRRNPVGSRTDLTESPPRRALAWT